jgi:hypothetical protein
MLYGVTPVGVPSHGALQDPCEGQVDRICRIWAPRWNVDELSVCRPPREAWHPSVCPTEVALSVVRDQQCALSKRRGAKANKVRTDLPQGNCG